jgi:hypothetical protein
MHPYDWVARTPIATLLERLRGCLDHRQSLLEAPQVVRYNAALELLGAGKASLSSFGYRSQQRMERCCSFGNKLKA